MGSGRKPENCRVELLKGIEKMKFDELPTPVYVIDEQRLTDNLKILNKLEKDTGCHVLLAQKAFSAFYFYPLIAEYISGATASGLFEARLGYEYMKKENHIFSPGYKAEEMPEICRICDHVIFNSFSQFESLKKYTDGVSVGIRVNPEHSTQDGHEIYDPCAPFSRMGVKIEDFPSKLPKEIEGLHFHTLCEQNSDDLISTFTEFEKKFGKYLNDIKWINLGGGHHITKPDYDITALEILIKYIIKKYGTEVYLEPGEAVALDAGYLVTEVVDIVKNGMDILILDASAACHMPDVLEMPYRPPLEGAGLPEEKRYTYRLASRTCLAGDIIGDYSFSKKIHIEDRLVFEDMAIYSMVKNNTFNGMPLPSIAVMHKDGACEVIKSFGYDDFKERLS